MGGKAARRASLGPCYVGFRLEFGPTTGQSHQTITAMPCQLPLQLPIPRSRSSPRYTFAHHLFYFQTFYAVGKPEANCRLASWKLSRYTVLTLAPLLKRS